MSKQIKHKDIAGVVIDNGDKVVVGESNGSTLHIGTVVKQTPVYVWFKYALPNGTWVSRRWPSRVAVIK